MVSLGRTGDAKEVYRDTLVTVAWLNDSVGTGYKRLADRGEEDGSVCWPGIAACSAGYSLCGDIDFVGGVIGGATSGLGSRLGEEGAGAGLAVCGAAGSKCVVGSGVGTNLVG